MGSSTIKLHRKRNGCQASLVILAQRKPEKFLGIESSPDSWTNGSGHGLFAVANFASHAAFFATDFASPFTRSFSPHKRQYFLLDVLL